jgi:glycosyltransferase involved in cell wall biosynthesis
MKLLTFSSLFPSSARPQHGLFVRTRLEQLLAEHEFESAVVAPVPWFPSRHPRFGRYAAFARTPTEERLGGLRVLHPRHPVLPKLGSALTPFAMAAAAMPVLSRLRREGYLFELIDAHYLYPDGVAAALLARRFGCPLILTARGSDLNVHAADAASRRLILWASRQAFTVVTVSQALRTTAVGIGIEADKTTVLRNGVDAERFAPLDRERVRRELDVRGIVLLSAGNLVAEKGHEVTLGALAALPDASLMIAGDGPQRAALERLAAAHGVAGRVRFLGSLPQEELIRYYNAADVLVLASAREGWPNVLLEAMACGTPVVAANVGGCPEIVSAPEAGVLLAERTPEALAHAVRSCVARDIPRAATRRHAERFGWVQTSRGQAELFRAAVRSWGGRHAHAERPC